MMASDIWTLVGLSLGTLGAVFLAYEVVFGQGNRFQAESIRHKLEGLKNTRTYVQASIKALPQPPYNPAEIKKLLDDEAREWGPDETKLTEQDKGFYESFENRVVTLGAGGVVLIVFGFALQIVGLLLHASGR